MTIATFSSGPNNDYSGASSFRGWTSALSAVLATVGLVKTTDTGQINLATVSSPGAINTSMGYEIWRLADALQATAPVFIKLEYGSGSVNTGSGGGVAQSTPSIWVTVGTGSDGAGNLTGIVFARTQLPAGTNDSAGGGSSVSGAPNRVAIALWAEHINQVQVVFGLERFKDASGADTNEGVLITCGAKVQATSTMSWTHCPARFGVALVDQEVSTGPVAPMTATTGAEGANIAPWPLVLASRRGVENPGANFLAYHNGDLVSGQAVPVNGVYTGSKTFKCFQMINALGWRSGAAVGTGRVAMRYE